MSKLIVIEGTDRSGKETQSKLLETYLNENNKKALRFSFPNYDSDSSIFVKKYLSGEFGKAGSVNKYHASLFYAVDRVVTYIKELKPIMNEYEYIILDRYIGSNLIHQAYPINENEIIDLEYCNYWKDFEINKLALPNPDITFLLDMPVDIGIRISEGRKNKITDNDKQDIHESDKKYMESCYNRCKEIANLYNWYIIKCYENESPKNPMDILNNIKSELSLRGII